MTDTTDEQLANGIDRRAALKKAAVAAGVVAWTTPAVQAVTAGHASAAVRTACSPIFTVTLRETGPSCVCSGVSPACCSDNTYFADVDATCGTACPGEVLLTDIDVIAPAPAPKPGCPAEEAASYVEFIGACPGAITIQAEGECPDGSPISGQYTATVVGCVECTDMMMDMTAGLSVETETETQRVIGDDLLDEMQAPEAPAEVTTDAPAEVTSDTTAEVTSDTTGG